MSSELPILKPASVAVSDESTADDIRLQVNLRFNREELEADLSSLRRRFRLAALEDKLVRLACRIYDARRERERVMGTKLFGEPGWDIMLALYCLPARGERLAVTALSCAAAAPQTTALRWQAVLQEDGLIERKEDPKDARRVFVELTVNGRALIEDYLQTLYDADPSLGG